MRKERTYCNSIIRRIVAVILVAIIVFNPLAMNYEVYATDDDTNIAISSESITTETPTSTSDPTQTKNPEASTTPSESPGTTPTPSESPVTSPTPSESPVTSPAPSESPVTSPAPSESPLLSPELLPDANNSLVPEDAIVDALSDTMIYGDFTVELPPIPDEPLDPATTYNIKVNIKRKTPDGNFKSLDNAESYLAHILLADGTTEERALKLSPNGWPIITGTISGLPAGAVVTVEDVLVRTVTEEWWNDYAETIADVEIISSDSSESVALKEDSQNLVPDGTTTFELDGEAGPEQKLTEDTFTNRTEPYSSSNGQYSLLYLLNNYNIVSLRDIEATHIVGPIIAQHGAYRTGDAYSGASHDGSDLVASDYSRGISSYVGKLYSLATNVNESALQLGYGFENTNPNFVTPHFYTRATDIDGDGYISVKEAVENWQNVCYVHLSRNGGTFLSPNANGAIDNFNVGVLQEEKSYTYQNDNFLDFATLWGILEGSSYALMENGIIDGVTDVIEIKDAGVNLELKAGNSYVIKDATHLETVNIVLPDGHDFFVNPWLPPTTISFEGATINPTTYQGYAVSRFPDTLINGKQLEALQGEGGEYAEYGNKIIWNLPNVVTSGTNNRLTTFVDGTNIAGHVVAVNAEFWNINAAGAWQGGNLNGAGIFADFHSGNMEMHMWPYGGLSEKTTFVDLEVEKIFTNGDLSKKSFSFTLTADENNPETGLVSTEDFPLKATTDKDGMAYFSSLVFDEEGTYVFYITEDIPTDVGNITYDTSRYTVTVNVTKSSSVEAGYTHISFSNTVTYERNDEAASGVVFTNAQDSIEESTTTSYSFTKVGETANPLSGAMFILTDIDPETSETAWDSPIIAVTSTNTGDVTFSDLTIPGTYYFKETKAPSGYELATGYWELSINEYGVITITAKGGADEATNDKIVNKATEEKLVDITLTKENEIGRPLYGAQFKLDEVYSYNNHVIVEGGFSGEYLSDENGEINITGLSIGGVYRLTETTAPHGYCLPFDISYWLLEVNSDATVTLYAVNIVGDGLEVTELDEYVLLNTVDYVLPTTGGGGTSLYTIFALLLMCSSGIIYSSNKSRKFIKR